MIILKKRVLKTKEVHAVAYVEVSMDTNWLHLPKLQTTSIAWLMTMCGEGAIFLFLFHDEAMQHIKDISKACKYDDDAAEKSQKRMTMLLDCDYIVIPDHVGVHWTSIIINILFRQVNWCAAFFKIG